MTDVAHDAWVERARSMPIEGEIRRRDIRLKGGVERIGPCPRCGGDDRFSINTKKQIFNCRGCKTGGDVIDLVRFLDGTEFIEACTTLAGEPPKPNGNGKDQEPQPQKVCIVAFAYRDEAGAVVLVTGRYQYKKSDGSFILKNGKPKKTFGQKTS